VARLCSQERIWSAFTKKRGLSRKPGPAVHDDLVERDFTAVTLDELWFTDITEHPTGEGKLYLCAIKDACSNRIVGYAMNDRMTAQLAVTALRPAITRRSPHGTSCGSRSSPGSNGPTTAGAANAVSVDSHPSSLK
jgi:putative transposase